jgi:hypothetical protein
MKKYIIADEVFSNFRYQPRYTSFLKYLNLV